jgi:thiamine pyrophosphate-dependent acetolactate synthase large subunit-like protein
VTERFPAALAAAVAAEDVSHVFGLMGAGTIELTRHLVSDHGVRYYSTRHEAGAVGAADGFARTGAGTGVAIVSSGPGVTNALTALTTAKRGASPLVLIAPDSDSASPMRYPFAGGTQTLDETLVLTALDIDIVHCDPRSVYTDTATAFARARDRQTPVVLLYPLEANGAHVTRPAAVAAGAVGPVEPRQAELEAAARTLSEAARPLVLAGLGAARAGAGESLSRLADRSGALLATSLRGAGLFEGYPYNLGICGGFARDATADLIAQSDCVLAFGASLNGFTTRRGELVESARIIQCDVDASAFHRFERPDVSIVGDARIVADRLCDLVERRNGSAHRAAAEEAGLVAASLLHPFDDVSSPGQLDPRAVCRRIDALLPEARTIVTDCGQSSEFPVEQMRVFTPESLLWMFDFGAVGSGLGAALGAAVAHPERTTVLFIGDGGLLMTLGDLDTAVRERIPLLVVCLNDRAFGAEVMHMQAIGVPVEPARFDTPDLAEIARAMGWDAATVDDLDDLDRLAPQIANIDRPTFLNCLIYENPVDSPLRPHV